MLSAKWFWGFWIERKRCELRGSARPIKIRNLVTFPSCMMCILFMYNGCYDEGSDYSLIVASNRDEYYGRPSQSMGPWSEDPNVLGGRDLEVKERGSWLAISPVRKKLGVILNLPRTSKPDAKTRGTIVADFVKCETTVDDYIDHLKTYVEECNDFLFIAVDISNLTPLITSYNNTTDTYTTYRDTCLGFGNSLPETPLNKVEAGKEELKKICTRLNKTHMKEDLVNELIGLLKSEQRYFPDPELELRRPSLCKELSSIFVRIPEGCYGTRTHTIILLTKTGHMDVIELTMTEPIDVQNPIWGKSEFQFDI